MQIEYCQYGSIRDIIKRGKRENISINELEISSIIYMILQSLVFIHKNNFIDRDIKGRNILVNIEGIVKLCDFGICKTYHKDNMKHIRGGSPYWMAPEVLNKEEYDQTIDVWALGITCIELAENEPPYFKLSPKEVMKQIIKLPPNGLNDKSKWSNEFNDFISCCLTVDRFKRPSAEELLKHDFITMIDNKNLNRKLIILQFLSKCGYKVLYSRKIKITPIINGNGNLRKNKMLYHKKGLDDIRIRNGKMYNSLNVNSYTNKNNRPCEYFENNKSSNKILSKGYTEKNNYKVKDINKESSLRPQSVFNKKLFLKCKSLRKDLNNFEKKIKSRTNNIFSNLIYKRNNTYLNKASNSSSNKYSISYENASLNSSNSISNTNKNNFKEYTNIKRSNFLKKFLREERIRNVIGKNIEEDFDEKYEFFEEDIVENNKDSNDKIIDGEIIKLLKQRDKEINNIILKYQDKLNKMKKEQNKSLMEKE
jgi:serine/threonine protein kinase